MRKDKKKKCISIEQLRTGHGFSKRRPKGHRHVFLVEIYSHNGETYCLHFCQCLVENFLVKGLKQFCDKVWKGKHKEEELKERLRYFG